MKLGRLALATVVGTLAGLVGGYTLATIALNLAIAPPTPPPPWTNTLSSLVLFAGAGAIVAMIQRASSSPRLPWWWLVASAIGWAGIVAITLAITGDHIVPERPPNSVGPPPPSSSREGMHLRLGIPAGFLFSLLVGGALVLRRRDVAPPWDAPAVPHTPARSSAFRWGATAVPAYLLFAGVGHMLVAQTMSAQATGPRDGQAFAGTFVLGLMFVVGALFALPFALRLESQGGLSALLRGTLVGLVVAAAVVLYTASRGIDRAEVPGVGPIIRDARPDLPIMLLGTLGAYALAHLVGRRPGTQLDRRET